MLHNSRRPSRLRRPRRAVADVGDRGRRGGGLSGVGEPRRDLFGEEPHLAQQVVQVLGLEHAERVLQARLPVPSRCVRHGVRASRERARASTGSSTARPPARPAARCGGRTRWRSSGTGAPASAPAAGPRRSERRPGRAKVGHGQGSQPLPYLAARRIAAGEFPPIQIGGPPSGGCGGMLAASKRWNRPW